MRGRKAKPAELKELQGNPGKRRIVKAQVDDAASGKIVAPVKLTAGAAKVWERLAPELQRMNFLRSTDAAAFARYCMHLARYWELSDEIRKAGGETYVTESKHGTMLRLHPKFVVRERLEARLESLEDRFGLTPSARQQLLHRMSAVPAATLPGLTPPEEKAKPEAAEAPAPADSPVGMLGRHAVH